MGEPKQQFNSLESARSMENSFLYWELHVNSELDFAPFRSTDRNLKTTDARNATIARRSRQWPRDRGERSLGEELDVIVGHVSMRDSERTN